VTLGIGRKRELEAAKQRKAEEEDKRRRLEEVERELAKKMQAKMEKERQIAQAVRCVCVCRCVSVCVCVCVCVRLACVRSERGRKGGKCACCEDGSGRLSYVECLVDFVLVVIVHTQDNMCTCTIWGEF